MRQITLSGLRDIMRACAGEDEGALPLEQAQDQQFDELGYDSLALLETCSRVQRDYGVELSDDEAGMLNTPRELVDHLNKLLRAG